MFQILDADQFQVQGGWADRIVIKVSYKATDIWIRNIIIALRASSHAVAERIHAHASSSSEIRRAGKS